jgi:hypothetical protein
VVGYLEAGWCQALESSCHAFLEVEDLSAVAAMKVMMVPLIGAFVARRLARDLNAADLPLLLKILQRSVDSGDPKGGNRFDGKAMDIIRQKGAGLFFKDGFDRLFLLRGASFGRQAATMLAQGLYFKPSTIVLTLCLIIES